LRKKYKSTLEKAFAKAAETQYKHNTQELLYNSKTQRVLKFVESAILNLQTLRDFPSYKEKEELYNIINYIPIEEIERIIAENKPTKK